MERGPLIRLLRPIRFGLAVDIFEGRLGSRKVVVRRYGPTPAGWPNPPASEVLRAMNYVHLQRFLLATTDDDGAILHVFAWYKGQTLRELLSSTKPFPIPPMLVLLHAARGLCWLHERGPAAPILHGDVSPANLFVTQKRAIWLDVGAFSPGEPPAGPGIIFGTLAYLAPEVLAGEPPKTSSEVFSLGIICLEVLCGPLPWASARTPSQVLAEQKNSIPALLAQTSSQPRQLRDILRAMLCFCPSSRPAMREVIRVFASS